MKIDNYISALIKYGISKDLFKCCDKIYITNRILEALDLDNFEPEDTRIMALEEILKGITDYAVKQGLCDNNTISRDLLDTKIMGILTPRPSEVQKKFNDLYKDSPNMATDWFYNFSQDTNYIRRYRIQKDMRWKTTTEYGTLDITINLSKPEKDPKMIAALKDTVQSGYPICQLCIENEGYAGRINHPARQNLRIIPINLNEETWFLQYSPYVYYNEHCIAINSEHKPMVIECSTFKKLLDFVDMFPHYFIGSNADLPIVGGSILNHEHFQGGNYCLPMDSASIGRKIKFTGYEDVKAGILRWPMSVIRLNCTDKTRLVELADMILRCWRNYTDEDAFIYSQTDGIQHNTITPIARIRDKSFELDLVLRNNITTDEHPLGVFHPHSELHHIKKENIGLIEVMGLAVLPSRLKQEMADIEEAILNGSELEGELKKHAAWVEKIKEEYTFTQENITNILKIEIGKVFVRVLEDAGVYKNTVKGSKEFDKFVQYVNQTIGGNQ